MRHVKTFEKNKKQDFIELSQSFYNFLKIELSKIEWLNHTDGIQGSFDNEKERTITIRLNGNWGYDAGSSLKSLGNVQLGDIEIKLGDKILITMGGSPIEIKDKRLSPALKYLAFLNGKFKGSDIKKLTEFFNNNENFIRFKTYNKFGL